jgi:hypothetical protein
MDSKSNPRNGHLLKKTLTEISEKDKVIFHFAIITLFTSCVHFESFFTFVAKCYYDNKTFNMDEYLHLFLNT